MLILVFGPSGVGKSTLFKHAAGEPGGFRYESMDKLARDTGRELGLIHEGGGVNDLRAKINDDNEFFVLGREAVEHLGKLSSEPLVVDVGAGFIDAPFFSRWLGEHPSVALVAPCQVIHRRIVQSRCDQRTLSEYKRQEYSKRRQMLYGQSTYKLNADCSVDAMVECFMRLLSRVVKNP